jgi:pheromone shutdown-related protein TraB
MITLLGVAHISEESVREVEDKIRTLKPGVVAVELCEARYQGLTQGRRVPILELIKSNNSILLLANVLLPFLQLKLAEEVGIKPGREMLRAVEVAEESGIPIALIDRDIRVTLRRAVAKMGFFEKLRVMKELVMTFGVSKEEIEKEISRAKDEAGLEEMLQEFKNLSPSMHEVLIRERDAYMAYNLLDLEKKHGSVVAVVGAGHKKGIQEFLANPRKLPSFNALATVPKQRLSIGRVLKFALPLFFIAMFAAAFLKGVSLKTPLGLWVLNHAVPTFIAVIIARGSLSAALAGTAASPLTSLNPFLAAGWFAGIVELKVRRVAVEDVSEMFRAGSCGQLMKNNAFRVILVAAFANIGSMLGTFISFPTIIYPLIKSMAG